MKNTQIHTSTFNIIRFGRSLAIIFGLIIGFSSHSLAQRGDREGHRDKIRSLKVGHFTEAMDLTPQQAEKFWPLYNEYFDQKRTIRRDVRSQMRSAKQEETTEEARLASQDKIIKLRRQELDLTESYRERFLKLISPKQYSQMYAAEEEFNRMLLEELRKRRRG